MSGLKVAAPCLEVSAKANRDIKQLNPIEKHLFKQSASLTHALYCGEGRVKIIPFSLSHFFFLFLFPVGFSTDQIKKAILKSLPPIYCQQQHQ